MEKNRLGHMTRVQGKLLTGSIIPANEHLLIFLTVMIVILMGVCGVGKTAVGEGLAHELGVPFRDADEFHSPENKCKMSNGIPLTDEDRLPWLQSINKYILEVMHSGSSAVVTCSALKRKYRHILLENCTNTPEVSDIVRIVYLRGSEGVIQERLSKRKGHFMPPALLKSQLMTLEEPDSAEPYCMTVNTDNKTVAIIVKEITILFNDLRQNLVK